MRKDQDCRLTNDKQSGDAYSAVDALARGDTDAAITILERAIAARPEDATLRNNYGVALMRLGRLDDAKREFERAIQLKRDYPDAFANLGQASLLLHDARAERDAKSARKALTREKDDYLYVERALLEALRLNPNHLNALLTLALLRRRQKRYTESAKTLERAKALDSDAQKYPMLIAEEYANARNWAQAADALQEIADERSHIGERATRKLAEYDALAGRRETAKRLFRAIKRDAYANQRFDSPEHWRYLGLCPFYFETPEQIDDYWRSLSAELDEAIAERPKFDWRTLAREGFIPSFQLAHHNRCCREIKEKFAQFYAPSFESERRRVTRQQRSGKFRIGFIASPGAEGGFLRSMSVVISRLDPEKWETVLIYRAASASAFARQDATLRVEIPEDFEQAAETIRELQCDAIYYWKVGGTTWDYFLPMLRLAPIQIASWGVHGTSGVSQIDYFISQKRAEIETAQEHYTEKLVLLNEAPIFQPLVQDVRKRTREELGLPPTGAIYFCPQRPAKYHPEFDRYFKEILDRDPNGSILITLGERDDEVSRRIKGRITKNVGATLAKRLIFVSRQSPKIYGQLFSVATVLLDSCVYSGCVTLYDALARGVPNVSLVGELLVQRFPFAAYRTMGVESAPLARTREEYVVAAVRLGREPDYRRALVDEIIKRRALVFEREQAVAEFSDFMSQVIESVRSL